MHNHLAPTSCQPTALLQDGDSTSQKLSGAVINALIFVGVVAVSRQRHAGLLPTNWAGMHVRHPAHLEAPGTVPSCRS